LIHALRDRGSVGAGVRSIQLERAGTVVDAVTGIDERFGTTVAGDADLGATNASARVRCKLLVVEERRDGGVSVVALVAWERVNVKDTAGAAV
jgi:hypothetical protein